MTATAQAQTSVLTFDDLTPATLGTNLIYEGYVFSPRYRFDIAPPSAALSGHGSNFVGMTASLALAGNLNPNYLGNPDDFGLLFVRRVDNQPFSLSALTAVGVLWGVTSSAGGAWGAEDNGPANFSGPEWSNLSWLLFGAGGGDPRGFDNLTLTAVPEPATAWLLGIGLGALALRRAAGRGATV